MNLTATLVGYLNRVWLRDPKPVLAIRITYAGPMTWNVSDQVLTLTPEDGSGPPVLIDLTAYTLLHLAQFVEALPGFDVPYLNHAVMTLSAIALLDGTGDIDTSNGDHLYIFTALPWAYLDAVAAELEQAQAQIEAMPAMMSVPTATGVWLDYLGADVFNVPRQAGEIDQIYAPRVIATVLRQKCNNVAIELAIQAYTGQLASVVDAVDFAGAAHYFDGTSTFNAAINYNSSPTSTQYNLFDVVYGYDLINGGSLTAFLAAVKGVIDSVRAAGCHLNAIALGGSDLPDSLIRTPVDAMAPLMISETFAYDGSVAYDGSSTYSGVHTYEG